MSRVRLRPPQLPRIPRARRLTPSEAAALKTRPWPKLPWWLWLAAVVTTLGVHTVHLGGIETTPRGIVLMAYAVAFPAVALIRTVIIARTGHIPRRQDLVGG